MRRSQRANFDLKMKVFYLEERLRSSQLQGVENDSSVNNTLGSSKEERDSTFHPITSHNQPEEQQQKQIYTNHPSSDPLHLSLLLEERTLELTERERLLSKAKKAIEGLRSELQKERGERGERDAQCIDLRRQVEELNNDLESCKVSLEGKREEWVKMHKDYVELDAKGEKEGERREGIINTLKGEVEALKGKLEGERVKNAGIGVDLREGEEAKRRSAVLEENLRAMGEEMFKVRDELEKVKQESRGIEGRHKEDLQRTLLEGEKREKERREQEEKMLKLCEDQADDLRRKLKAKEEEVREMRAEAEVRERELGKFRIEAEDRGREVEGVRRRQVETEEELVVLRKEMVHAKRQLVDVAALKARNEGLEKKHQESDYEGRALHQKLEEAENRNAEIRRQAANRESSLKLAMSQFEVRTV